MSAVCFSERELKHLVLQKTDTQVQCDAVLAALATSDKVYNLGLGEDGRIHYVTRVAFEKEAQLSQLADTQSAQQRLRCKARLVEKIAKPLGLNADQWAALHHITTGADLAVAVGVAGSGKTSYMLKAANTVWGSGRLSCTRHCVSRAVRRAGWHRMRACQRVRSSAF